MSVYESVNLDLPGDILQAGFS